MAEQSAHTRIIPASMLKSYERAHYAPAVQVAAGGRTIYVSGQVGRGPDRSIDPDPEAQITQAWENLGTVLAEAVAGFGDVVDLLTFHTDMAAHLGVFAAVKDRYLPADFPAWTAIGCTALAEPGLICEIKAVAVVP